MATRKRPTSRAPIRPAGREVEPAWDDATHRRLIEDLRVHREELAAQQATLLESRHELELSHEEYQELFDLGPLGCLVLDANGVIQRSNLAAARLLEVERVRLANCPMLVFVAEPDRRAFLDHMHRCRHGDELVTTELTLRTRGRTEILVELSSHAFATRRNARVSYHTSLVDLRERRRLELERLRAAEERQRALHEQQRNRAANEAKDRFLAMLSHELRTPLTPVMLATSSWKDDATIPEPLRQTLAMIHRNVALEARLIDDLLDLTRIAQSKLGLQPEIVDLHATIEEVVDALRAETAAATVTCTLDLRARQRLRADPLRLRQVVWNLVRNAIHYTSAGGRVTVATHDAGPDRTKFTVTDTGIGFDPETRDQLFAPFDQGAWSTTAGGLGLGLAIAKGIVEAHGGTITAFSEGVGRGARFEVHLPATDAAPGAIAAATRVEAPTSRPLPLRILLVEDHADTSTALAFALEHEGYSVELATSVADALATAERNDIDLLVSDLGLPDGSGLDLMRTLKARKPIRGIALTGYGRREDVADTRDAGFERHLTKPVDLPNLIAAIESLRADV